MYIHTLGDESANEWLKQCIQAETVVTPSDGVLIVDYICEGPLSVVNGIVEAILKELSSDLSHRVITEGDMHIVTIYRNIK